MESVDLNEAYEMLIALQSMFPKSRLVASEVPLNESNESLTGLTEWLQQEFDNVESAAAKNDRDAVDGHLIMARSHSLSLSNLFMDMVEAIEKVSFSPEESEE